MAEVLDFPASRLPQDPMALVKIICQAADCLEAFFLDAMPQDGNDVTTFWDIKPSLDSIYREAQGLEMFWGFALEDMLLGKG